MSLQCQHCGFRPQLRPAGGVCPWCGKPMCTPGCLVILLWIIVAIAIAAAL
jgi:hypothetical protein